MLSRDLRLFSLNINLTGISYRMIAEQFSKGVEVIAEGLESGELNAEDAAKFIRRLLEAKHAADRMAHDREADP